VTSFIRSIQREEKPEYVDEILSRTNHFIPLRFHPTRASCGDYIYLAYRGRIVGRAVIDQLQDVSKTVPFASDQHEYEAKCLIRYRGGWQRPPRHIAYTGTVSIRYLDTMGLEDLDTERW
jgi:hypothetical protein